ncbi:MAG: hypothetical protein LC655_09260, partial [Bacteroidales bacterium]|nr:hypothetical protein [Bacteroidales bacterium]
MNDPPVVENPIADRVVNEYFGSIDINLSNVFSDPDGGDVLGYSAISSNSAVVTVSVAGAILTITESGPGTASITVTASDGSLSVEDQFSITVIYINLAPELTEPIPDQNFVENIGSAELDLDAYFSDRNGDALVYSVAMRDAGIVSYVLDQSMLQLTPVGAGSTMVTITASDPEGLMAEGSFMVDVEEELMFLVQYGSRRLQNRDTITICNDAGQIDVRVITKANWGFTNDYLWMALEIMQDSTLSVAFSSNLTGEDRIGDVTLFSAQGHVLKFFVKQTEHCLTSVFPDDRRFDLKMYPNPVEGRLFIDTGGWLRRGMKVEVIDQKGKLLFVEEVEEDAPGAP